MAAWMALVLTVESSATAPDLVMRSSRVGAAKAFAAPTRELLITKSGAVADDSTVNTRAIQAAIDQLAAKGGGTIVVPKGVFVSGALFFKPKVHLRLTEGAVLKCSTDLSNFPAQRTRIEGHFMDNFTPAFINASGDDYAVRK